MRGEGRRMKNKEILNDGIKIEALNDMIKMWMWLYKHPAHDKKYYVSYVADLDRPWKNNCPICDLADEKCSDCLLQWDEQKGTFCTDPESPYSKWQGTGTDSPDLRTFYACEIIALVQHVKEKIAVP
jgi:hypothetical protein